MTFKKTIRTIHLWLGLASGLVILILGITGCILAFQVEIENTFQRYRFVEEEQREFMRPSKLKEIAMAELPGKEVHAVMYQGRQDAAQVIFYDLVGEDAYYYYTAFLNPYTGVVQKVKNLKTDFFRVILDGHFYLWLPERIGQPVVASATLVFVVMMISGIILWWPRNKAAAKQRFSIKWSAKWKRKNYDLHNVLGFYSTWICIILAITGLVWGFEWFAQSYYTVAGGERSLVYQEPVSDTAKKINHAQPAIDVVYEMMKKRYPDAEAIEVHTAVNDSSAIAANANPDVSTYWKADYVFFDQYTFDELPANSIYGKMDEASFADKLMRANYDIHTGAILGIAGKILMFFASLIAASLPVTGFYIWLGRKKKKKIYKEMVYESGLATTA
ncbi:MAG: PepSY domain-containing protein [Chitinophagaceae bacterium]|nr:PepSY domain-containing protein [Chitinophagaceae bacterium]